MTVIIDKSFNATELKKYNGCYTRQRDLFKVGFSFCFDASDPLWSDAFFLSPIL